jgi:hypothetical protein
LKSRPINPCGALTSRARSKRGPNLCPGRPATPANLRE